MTITDILPARNMGRAEYWARTIESRILALKKLYLKAGQDLGGLNRHHASSGEDLAQRIARLEARLAEIRAAYTLLPVADSGAAAGSGFGLAAGWQTIATIPFAPPAGKTSANVVASGQLHIEAPTVFGAEMWAWPFPLSTVSSEYGPRTGGASDFHEGIDFARPSGTPIPAPSTGTVVSVGYNSSMGNYVIIDHPSGGARTRYFHMVSPPPVSSGQVVNKGQTIGYVGNTGLSYGAHLHWETWINGQHVNPRFFMSQPAYGAGVASSSLAPPSARILIAGHSIRDFGSSWTVDADSKITFNLRPIHGHSFRAVDAFDVSLQLWSASNWAAHSANQGAISAFGEFS